LYVVLVDYHEVMNKKLLFLGSGSSMGVPVIGCSCDACKSSALEDKRLRPSVLLMIDGKYFLIDIGPDYRQQALRYNIDRLDGLLLTHPHYDHIGGLDELRVYAFLEKRGIPCLLSSSTLEELKVRYYYLLLPCDKGSISVPKLKFQLLEGDSGKTVFEGLHVGYFSYIQMGMKVNGFRFDNLAYVTDIMEYDENVFDALVDIEVLIISARRHKNSVAHLNIEQAIEFAKRSGAKMTYFTHISHEIHHEKVMKGLKEGFALASDGMEIVL
jgi:phosphoribosyl 1,2-cyclic phosphate phosphodiesterase